MFSCSIVFCSKISDTKSVGLFEVLFCTSFICGTTNEFCCCWHNLPSYFEKLVGYCEDRKIVCKLISINATSILAIWYNLSIIMRYFIVSHEIFIIWYIIYLWSYDDAPLSEYSSEICSSISILKSFLCLSLNLDIIAMHFLFQDYRKE